MSIPEDRARRRSFLALKSNMPARVGLALLLSTGGCRSCAGCDAPESQSPLPPGAPVDEINPALGRIVWHDYVTNEPGSIASFYSAVTGWTLRKDGSQDSRWLNGSEEVAGLQRPDEWSVGDHPFWRPTILVSDVGVTVRQAADLKGTVLSQPVNIATGVYAAIQDPAGRPFNVFQATAPTGLRDLSRPGECSWNVYVTTDGDGALAFYGKLFGWVRRSESTSLPSGKYVTLARNEIPAGPKDMPIAGVQADPTLGGHAWVMFVQVPDIDAAVQTAKAKGATIVTPPSPAIDGRLAVLNDPQGAVFGLHENARSE